MSLAGAALHASPYAGRFESGAKLNPQVLVLVERAPAGPLGVPAGVRAVRVALHVANEPRAAVSRRKS